MGLLKFAQNAVNKTIGGKQGGASEMAVGDRVLHTVSGIRGVLEGIETSGGNVVFTIRTMNGQVLSKLSSREFRLASEVPVTSNAPSHADPVAASARVAAAAPVAAAAVAVESAPAVEAPVAAEHVVDLKMDCSEGFSAESILDEL